MRAASTVLRKMAPRRVRIDRCLGSMATSVYDNWSRSIELTPCPGWVNARLFTVSVVTAFPLGATTCASNDLRSRSRPPSWETRRAKRLLRTAHASRAASGACWTAVLVGDHVRWWDPRPSLDSHTQTPRTPSSSLSWVTTWIVN